MRLARLAIAVVITVAACGGHAPHSHARAGGTSDDEDAASGPFSDRVDFKPTSFSVDVSGEGRPVIFIPGLGCPGEIWADTVARLGDEIEAHVLTLAGFAGQKPIKGYLSATVRKELVRYIHAHRLRAPIIVGHSLGGFVAYWLAATQPGLVGGVIVVDAGPALNDTDEETARELRHAWAQSDDEELHARIQVAYSAMTADPRRIAPFLPAIERSDRQTMGNAVYELTITDLRETIEAITAPVLLVLADGRAQGFFRKQAEVVPDHEVIVLKGTRHFVMLDDPAGFVRVLRAFFAAHPNR